MVHRISVVLAMMSFIMMLPDSAEPAWHIQPDTLQYEYAAGESFTIAVMLDSSGNDIDALGFDFHFPPELIEYTSADFSGTLLNSWMFKDINLLTSGMLRIAGFTTTGIISPPARGTLLKLNFTVKSGVTGEGQIFITGFTDDLADATTEAAIFRVRPAIQIAVSAPDTTGVPGQIIDVPIYVEDLTGKDVFALSITIKTQPTVLTPIDIAVAGTILAQANSVTSNINEGEITVSCAGIAPFTGGGKLIVIRYQVNASAQEGQSIPIDIVEVLFNEGDPAALLRDGSFTVFGGYRVSGRVSYFSHDQSIPEVVVALDSNQTMTGTDGEFSFQRIPSANYTLMPTKNGELTSCISSFDAALILRYSEGLLPLIPYQMIAADVSGNGSITAFDASYILRYSVGLITDFPVNNDWIFIPEIFPISEINWQAAPTMIEYTPLNSDQVHQNFKGVIYGDVSGSWGDSGSGGITNGAEVQVGPILNLSAKKIIVPLKIIFFHEAYSCNFSLKFDDSKLNFISTKIMNSPTDLIFASSPVPGKINFGLASAHSLREKEINFRLLFERLTSPKFGYGNLEIVDMMVDEKATLHNKLEKTPSSEQSENNYLFRNHPNPFNPETIIRYKVSTSCHVVIEVFNTLGQKIRTLVNSQQPAGTYVAKWDGTDEKEMPVVSGVYYYRIRAGEFTAIRKMVLVR